jgi:histidinol-phosphate/aromatic aminotransferase/cobyric acid decarboxylase-like protein
MPNRKIIDIYQINKQHFNYVKFARDTLKNVAERKAQYKREITEKDAEFQNQINEVKANENRIKKELADIKIQNVQEYANYCIFISSK